MVYRPNVDERLCFVLMPFKEPFDDYYKKIIAPAAAEAGLQALRADDIYGNGVIIREIWDQIWFARVVIADVTDKNPNVNYELGLCHALGVPTILITRRKEDIPFDYQHRRYIAYNTDEVGWDQKLREDLRKTIETVSKAKNESDLVWPYDTHKVASFGGGLLLSIENPRDLVVQGAQIVGKRVGKALGPAGQRFSISLENREPLPYKQGYSIAQGTRSSNPLEARGIAQMLRLAQEVSRFVGDGTKTSMLLARSMMHEGNEALRRGHATRDLISGMKKALDHTLQEIKGASRAVRGDNMLQVASTAAADHLIGILISEAMDKVGKDGVITIEESTTQGTTLEVVGGFQFDRGYLSDQFITDHERNEVVLENPYILIHERKISSMKDLLPLLEEIAKANESLLIIAEDVEGEALATLVINKLRATLKVAAVKAPGFGDRRHALLDDIAILTGGRAISADLGINLESVKLDDLGKAKNVTINRDFTTILEGRGNPFELQGRIKTLRAQAEEALSGYDRERLAERIAKLVGGVAVIRVGGMSEIEVLDKKYKTISAMHSARSAIEEGWVPGGGVALYHAARSVSRLVGDNEAESAGIGLVVQALQSPMSHLIENAQKSTTHVFAEISQREEIGWGLNIDTTQVEDLAHSGVIDSVKMLRVGLELAYAHATSVLETEEWDLEDPKPFVPISNA